MAPVDLDQGDIGLGIGPHHLGGVGFSVIGRNLERLGMINDVVVGHAVTVCRDKEAGALRELELLHSASIGHVTESEVAKESLERGAFGERLVLIVAAAAV